MHHAKKKNMSIAMLDYRYTPNLLRCFDKNMCTCSPTSTKLLNYIQYLSSILCLIHMLRIFLGLCSPTNISVSKIDLFYPVLPHVSFISCISTKKKAPWKRVEAIFSTFRGRSGESHLVLIDGVRHLE